MSDAKEDVYTGDLVAYPGPWSFQIGKSHIILVSDQELERLSDPDAVLDLSLTFDKYESSLRQICERARAAGQRTLILAFDHFFSQYRPGQEGKPRKYTPDTEEYIQHIAAISRFAKDYGLRLELSLLSPLEIGPAFQQRTGQSGMWMHYRKGLRDPKTGAYSVQMWRQRRWANNKGPINVEDAGVRVFAFNERPLRGSPYRVVLPEDIVEITDSVKTEVWDSLVSKAGDYKAVRVRYYAESSPAGGERTRVLVVQQYRTPEMDYFSEDALPFLKQLIDRYAEAGVELNGLYSDEMHIQQDWAYFSHHDHGEFALRYVSDGFAKRFSELYGEQYRDFAKYLVYFVYGQEDAANDLTAKSGVMHVFGDTPEAVRETALFRSRYYRLLQDGVVDLFVAAKHYAELRMGRKLEARAHATWAESPTVDYWRVNAGPHAPHQYEYTPNFVWSCTVHQAASACFDYFKWGDFLTGNGNDHCEGGWLDRNYFGLALACSTGILNEVPYSYAAHWGMPHEIARRRNYLVNAYGAAAEPLFGLVEGMEHRNVDVLMLYPIDLVAVEERFGSWMTQYGYANYITADKLLERGKVSGGALQVAGRSFTTLVVLFEPFPSVQLLEMMRQFVEGGGRVIWSGPPPVLSREGSNVLHEWQEMFGVEYVPGVEEGLMAPGRQVVFSGVLADVKPQYILTDFLVDRIYPVALREGTQKVAEVRDRIVGTYRQSLSGKGSYTFLGYRPRDDQSQSLGYDVRNWFEVLCALGAYAGPSGVPDDNTEYLSRIGNVLCCRFPNGALAFAPHLRTYEEGWPGGFARNDKEDAAYLERRPPPSDDLELSAFRVQGHVVDYKGKGSMAFRVDEEGNLIAFAGNQTNQITVDGRVFVFSDAPLPQIGWGPVEPKRSVPGGAVMQILIRGTGQVRIPVTSILDPVQVFAEGTTPGSRGNEVSARVQEGQLFLEISPEVSGRWLYVVPKS
ncbi:MAG TPA: hypothetical protein PKY35_11015 [Candidatus Hydrogenedentes bacterium]|nr:hypothetical protein [Candidatus Hydrogenedentota bacterium]HOL77548.1 hypothetical protein [Candidatus Hydrogenedentota bacterium]HPO84853.1 hypothetical protein [Candidatus Hydrogenedentota bacterium]